MAKQLLLAGGLGGIVMFAWLGFSWTVLPLHRSALRELPTESPTAVDSLGAVSARHGVYYSGEPHAGSTAAEIPFMVYLPSGYPPMAGVMTRGVLFSLLAALGVAFVVLSARRVAYLERLLLCTVIGAVVACAGPVMSGNFFFHPAEWVWPEVFDQLFGWTLAGLVIAAFTRPHAPAPAVATVPGAPA